MMRRRSWVIVVLCLSVFLLFSQLSSASTALQVNEAAIRIVLADETTKVSLAVMNPASGEIKARVRLEVLDPQGALRASSESDEVLRRGSSALVISLPLKLAGLSEAERNAMLWYRLHYSLSTEQDTGDEARSVEGIVSLSEITPDLFELRVAASSQAREGMRYHARALALHPVSSRPVAGVLVEGELAFDDGAGGGKLKASGVTGEDGSAPLDFDLPKGIKDDDELKLTVRASHSGLVEEAENDVRLERNALIMLSTDKPLYQPGQTLHLRALCFDGAKHALSNVSAKLTIEDPEWTTVFHAPLSTTRFGVASLDWPIPESTRLGDYHLKLELDDERYSNQEARQLVRISRYELPNFAVNVRPDRAFYLPGQDAEVEVRADYLFGQPVRRGHVRVVRETERTWNYQLQKWETKEAATYEGETAEDGRFPAHIKLEQEHADLASEDYSRFQDLSYAAYFTDPTTNRTEQRRFELRLTKDAIHIYIFSGIERQTKNFPLQFYLSTYYADGTPAQCDVAINDARQAGDDPKATARFLRIIRTNRFGVAKVEGLALAHLDDRSQSAALNFVAHDKAGARGSQTNDFWLTSNPVIRLETDKAIYRAGVPIKATITASEPRMKLVVDVWRGELSLLRSQPVELHDGQAKISIPYSADFKDGVTLTAYAAPDAQTTGDDLPAASRQVLYPSERDLRLNVQLNRETYRPGDDAHADFSVSAPGGGAIESALGVVVFDSAVEERARTDREFGADYGFYGAYRYLNGYAGEISGIGGADIFKLDRSKPVPADLSLVAEILLRTDSHVPEIFGGDGYEMGQRSIFSALIEKQIAPLKRALDEHYALKMEYPPDESGLRAQLDASGINFERLLDPWGTPYRARFHAERELDAVDIVSAGADKRFETGDDFKATSFAWPYFRPLGETINRVANDYHARTGGFIRDRATLKEELHRAGIELDALKDRWGQPYRFDFAINGSNYLINVMSGGADAHFEQTAKQPADDFDIWTTTIDYFMDARTRIEKALADYAQSTKSFPQTDAELHAALSRASINPNDLHDPWGRNYYMIFSRDARYGVPHILRSYSVYGESGKLRQEVTPGIEQMNHLYLRSRGPDKLEGTADDFNVAEYSRLLVIESALSMTPPGVRPAKSYSGATGAISGTVLDPQAAVIANAQVTATRLATSEEFHATSDDEGRYLLRNLPAGLYSLEFTSTGFAVTIVDKVPVQSSNLTRLDATLMVGATSAVVNVTADGGAALDISSNTTGTNVSTGQFSNFPTERTVQSLYSIAPTVARSGLRDAGLRMVTKSGYGAEYGRSAGGAFSVSEQVATPRLRENFSETLLWQPSLETDASGHAQLDFKLADNITTWKMAVIGSTVDGEIGIAEREIRAFQPFFVEHDPPRVLTEGDEIQLPIVVRNYLDKPQDVNLKLAPASWFTLLGPAEKRLTVAAGDSSRQTFDFRAVASVREGGQMITAEAEGGGDRIQKPVTVHPDGEETAVTDSQLINDSATLNLRLPPDTIENSVRAELKIYPDLMAHVFESIEAILHRPYGCGEQTISSTYPSLLVLKHDRRTGRQSAIAPKALRYLRAGYERLLNYRAEGGGFSYWGGRNEADLALTAYALRFLNDAKQFIAVDEDVANSAREWLVKQQQPEGYWRAHYSQAGDTSANLMLTAYIARVLAATEAQATSAPEAVKTPGGTAATAGPGQSKPAPPTALERALAYLSRRSAEMNEPYLIAAYALAARDAGDLSGAARATARLRSLAHEENRESFWAIETNTPFHGWGLAGSIETTALAVQALAAENQADALVNRGLLFLLRRKDSYGVWYSTQATINVLDALIALLNRGPQESGANGLAANAQSNAAGTIEVIVNGRRATEVRMPPAGEFADLINVDLTSFLAPGDNRIELQQSGSTQRASVQAVATYYVPWSDRNVGTNGDAPAGASPPLKLKVSFDKSELAINDEVTCKVLAERTGRESYGMLLAEIGLPPGADVDRASLEKAMNNSGWALSRYDILPDRLTVYLWPRDGGTSFEFKFRPRYGLAAQTAASQLYDYYNPEARAVVAPTKFVVR